MNFRDNFGGKSIQTTKMEYICDSLSQLDTSKLTPQNKEKADELIDRLILVADKLIEMEELIHTLESLGSILGWLSLINEFSDKWDALINHFLNLDTETVQSAEIEFQEQLSAISNKYTGSRRLLHDQIYSLMVNDPDGFISSINAAFDTLNILEDKVIVSNMHSACLAVLSYAYTEHPDFDLSVIDSFQRKRIVLALFKLLCLISTERFAREEKRLTGITPNNTYTREIALKLFELFASTLNKDLAIALIEAGNVASLYFELSRPVDSVKPDSELLQSCIEYFGELTENHLSTINIIVPFMQIFKGVYRDNGFEHLFPAVEH